MNVDTKLRECFPCLHFLQGIGMKTICKSEPGGLGGTHEWERDDTGKLERLPDDNDISVAPVYDVVTFSPAPVIGWISWKGREMG